MNIGLARHAWFDVLGFFLFRIFKKIIIGNRKYVHFLIELLGSYFFTKGWRSIKIKIIKIKMWENVKKKNYKL